MNPVDQLHRNILENMSDGVMALDFKGRITLFNPAAAEILGMDRDGVWNRTFADVFMGEEEINDEFNQIILDAVLQRAAGRRDTVDFMRPGGSRAVLTLTSSYLRGEGDEQARGVIVVFSDVTELKTLQEQERENSRKLARAYGDLEETNTRLTLAVKKMRWVRLLASVGVVLLFLGLGLFHFQVFSGLMRMPSTTAPKGGAEKSPATAAHTLVARPLTASISLSGRLQPVEEIVITAPFDAKIIENNFIFGQRVREGDLLLVLDPSELEVKLRDARSAHIKAVQKYEETLDWETGPEMAKARRSVQRAENKLETDRRKFEESELLFSKGLVPANELDTARQQLESSTTDVIASREDFEGTRQKGGPDHVKIAFMELENARAKVEELELMLSSSQVRAPVSGVVIQPVVEADKKISLEKGARVQAGASLIALGDLSGLRVMAKVDEVDIGKVLVDQKVMARGDAFPGIVLEGHVAHISAQATGGTGQQAPTFDVQVTLPELTPEAEEAIRVGMSADLEVRTHDNPAALLAPLHLVRSEPGRALVRVLGEDGRIEEREVETGMTTLSEVEIVSGVQAGERLAEWTQ